MSAEMARRAPGIRRHESVAIAPHRGHIGVVTEPAHFDSPKSPRPPVPADAALGVTAAPNAIESIADGVEHCLDPRYLLLQRRRGWINAVVYSVMWILIGSSIAAMLSLPTVVSRTLFVLWAVGSMAYAVWSQKRPAIAYRHASYRLDAHGIEIRDGVLWRRVINVPRSRVQHIDVSQGPFERRHGIGTLAIYTAGVSHAMVTLPGLEHGRALRIRDYLLPRADDDGI
jgi:membrane protein YdbS with pleckstrin-like domain